MNFKIKNFKIIIILFFTVVVVSFTYAFKITYYTFVDALLDIQKGKINVAIEKLELTIRLDKTALEAYKQLLPLYIIKGNVTKVKDISLYLLENVDDIETLYSIGNLLLDNGYIEDSKKFFDKTKSVVSKNKNLTQEEQKQFETGYSSNSLETKIVPFVPNTQLADDIEELIQLGLKEYKFGRISNAIDIFRKVVSLDNNDDTAKLILADLLSFTTTYASEAKEIYTNYLEKNKEDYDTMLKLLILLLATNDIDSAEKYVRILETLPQEKFPSEGNYYISIFYELKKDFVKAAQFMEKYFKVTKTVPLNPYLKIGYYYSMIKNFSKSEKYLLTAIKKFDSFEAKIVLAFVYLDQKKFDKCIKVLKDIEKHFPPYERVYFYLGYCYDQKGKFDIAEQYFLESISKYPQDHESMNYLGYSYVDKNIKLDQAEYYIKKALELDPENIAYLDSLAWLYYRFGKYQDAEEILDKISLKTKDTIILEHLGEVKEKLGKKDEAITVYKKILELEPKNFRIKRKLNSVKK